MLYVFPIKKGIKKHCNESLKRLNEIWEQDVSKLNILSSISEISDKKNLIYKYLFYEKNIRVKIYKERKRNESN